MSQKYVRNMGEKREDKKVSYHQGTRWFKLLFSSTLLQWEHGRVVGRSSFEASGYTKSSADASEPSVLSTWCWYNLLIFPCFGLSKLKNPNNTKGTRRIYTTQRIRSPILQSKLCDGEQVFSARHWGMCWLPTNCLYFRKTTVLSTQMKSKSIPCCSGV